MLNKTFTFVAIRAAVLFILAGCGIGSDPSDVVPAEAPTMLAKADGSGDQADQSCLVVLRSVGRVSNGTGGYQTTCDLPGYEGGDCRYIWVGSLDVDTARLDSAVSVEVLFKTGTTQGQWYSTEAELDSGAAGDPGYTHFTFRITEFTPSSGMSYTSLNRTVIDFIPYVKTADGRQFDHNRVADPLDSYHLSIDNGWSIQPVDVCLSPAPPEMRFTYPDFEETLWHGPVTAGGTLKVVYDGRRLRDTQPCMGGEGAVSSTTLEAHWMLDNDGTVHSAQVEQYMESYGYACNGQPAPCITDTVSEPVIDIPIGVSFVSLWFTCTGMGHGDPSGVDSNYGQNYVVPVGGSDAPAWVGGWLVKLSRETGDACEGGAELGAGFAYDTWARQRAAITNLCFEVYQPQVTDFDNPDLWRALDVRVHTRFAGEAAFAWDYVDFAYRTGNNARYAFDLRGLDPFRPYHCPTGEVTPISVGGEGYVQSQVEFFVTVNGAEIRPDGPGSAYLGTFTDYATSAWRDENCGN